MTWNLYDFSQTCKWWINQKRNDIVSKVSKLTVWNHIKVTIISPTYQPTFLRIAIYHHVSRLLLLVSSPGTRLIIFQHKPLLIILNKYQEKNKNIRSQRARIKVTSYSFCLEYFVCLLVQKLLPYITLAFSLSLSKQSKTIKITLRFLFNLIFKYNFI